MGTVMGIQEEGQERCLPRMWGRKWEILQQNIPKESHRSWTLFCVLKRWVLLIWRFFLCYTFWWIEKCGSWGSWVALHVENEEGLKSIGNLDRRRQEMVSELTMKEVGRKSPQDPMGKNRYFLPIGLAGGVGSVQWSVWCNSPPPPTSSDPAKTLLSKALQAWIL